MMRWALLAFILTSCGTSGTIGFWLTNKDKSALLARHEPLQWGASPAGVAVVVDSATKYQTIDGFGFALTGGSAWLINHLSPDSRSTLLHGLFGSDSSGIGVSYLRVSIGASDLSTSVYSYDDQADPGLAHFNLMAGDTDVVPVLKQILALDPNIKILGSPWSAPTWMKSNHSTIGGNLLPQYYEVYANYLVKYVQAMHDQGITIDALTPQNEPMYGGNNPSMLVTAPEEDSFVRLHLVPALRAAGLATKVIVYDHNCDHPEYPMSILKDDSLVDGSAFHLYAGDISALTTVHDAYPQKNLYFTEIYTGSASDFGGDLDWHMKNVVIGATRNYSRNVLEWNLASDPNYNPHTPGGCNTCKGAVTIAPGNAITFNVSYYIIAHASRFVPAGSVRIASGGPASLPQVAFLRPDGKKVLIVENDNNSTQAFNIEYGGQRAVATLNAGAVGTFIW